MSVNYYWDTDRGRETDWVKHCMWDLERVLNNVHHGKYEDVYEHIKKWRDHPSNVGDEDGNWLHYPAHWTDDECYGMAVAYLQSVLDKRVRILKKLANLYRKNGLEDMTVEDRQDLPDWGEWLASRSCADAIEKLGTPTKTI